MFKHYFITVYDGSITKVPHILGVRTT